MFYESCEKRNELFGTLQFPTFYILLFGFVSLSTTTLVERSTNRFSQVVILTLQRHGQGNPRPTSLKDLLEHPSALVSLSENEGKPYTRTSSVHNMVD